MQRFGRCPRCGYVLRFDGRQYTCDFCGFPREQRSLMAKIGDVERNIRGKVNAMVDGLRQQRQVYVNYPIATRPCTMCGASIPLSFSRCPSCGSIQTSQPSTLANTPPEPAGVDRRVFDYIVAHDGTISLSQAARDLSLPQDAVQSSIDRLKSSGLLNQT